jgi:glutamate-ammonia-ligase adenylyltransferase
VTRADTEARFDRFRDLGGVVPDGGDERRLLTAILDSGSFLPELLFADVTDWPALAADPWLRRPKPSSLVFAEASRETAAATDFADFKRRLRLVRRREMLRLGARELGWGTTEEVAAELSAFADACLELSWQHADADLRREYGTPVSEEEPPAFVVLAMGKLGGEELNFSSDVDLCYFYSSDAGEAGRLSLHEYYVHLSRRITAALEESTAEGMVFRVDLRLRPEGRSGPICNSLAAAERYYETFGRTWERQALLRARACAGDRAFGQRLLKMLEPFIYPRHIDPNMVGEVRALRAMFRTPEGDNVGTGLDVKLGAGCIRDVELVAQTLQLLHGGKRPDLRERSTPRSLQRLRIAGLLTDREARALLEAYRFWRRLEHRVQLENGAQTHRLPGDDEGRARLAERLGWPGLAALDADIDRHRAAVEAIAATFDDPQPGDHGEIAAALDPARPREEVQSALAALGFADAESWADSLAVVRARMPPAFLAQAAAAPDPDRALARLRDLTLRGSVGLVAMLRDQPQLLRMLATLFGTSDRLSELLIRHPNLWEPFTENLGAVERAAAELAAAAAARIGALDAGADDAEEQGLRELRRFQAEELLRVGIHDVSGSLDPGQVSDQLAGVAEACIAQAIALTTPPLVARSGVPSAGLTVLGLGSLGAREMRYGSDIDLVFLYASDGESSKGIDHRQWYARASQRLISALEAMLEEGRLYEVDTRLRPSGGQGMLVTSFRAFERYHQSDAAAWERVALLRARVVYSAEPPEARAALEATLERIAYEHPFDDQRFRDDLRAVRQRVENERRKVVEGARHLRFDPGGIMDVELLAALGQLRFAADPAVRTTSTLAALQRLAAAHGWPASLAEDYTFLRRLALRLRLIGERPEDVVGAREIASLARTLDRPADALGVELGDRMARVRAFYLATI